MNKQNTRESETIRQYQRLEYGERSIRKVNMGLGLSLCRTLEIDPFLLVPDEGKDKSKKIKS